MPTTPQNNAARVAEHTPGPWNVMDGAIQSKVLTHYGNWIVADCNRLRTDEDEANLRLIAAAPDLLDALERIMEYAHDGARMLSHSERQPQFIAARAAIAKAKGH